MRDATVTFDTKECGKLIYKGKFLAANACGRRVYVTFEDASFRWREQRRADAEGRAEEINNLFGVGLPLDEPEAA